MIMYEVEVKAHLRKKEDRVIDGKYDIMLHDKFKNKTS